MSVVVQLQPKGPQPTEATRLAIETALVRLARQHGCYEVATIALCFVAEAVEIARAKHRPTTDAWVADLKERFEQALSSRTP